MVSCEGGERGGNEIPSRMGWMQAAWMGVGLRIAMAPSESTSHLSMPRSAKLSGVFVESAIVWILLLWGVACRIA